MTGKGAIQEYTELYTEGKCIGSGKFGRVYLVHNKADKKPYVAKKIALDGLAEKEIESAFNEVLPNFD